jgi:hypothetical protein
LAGTIPRTAVKNKSSQSRLIVVTISSRDLDDFKIETNEIVLIQAQASRRETG